MSAAMELWDVSVRLGRRAALEAVTLAVEAGEVLGVLGANGAGKTTLLRAALGLQRLSAGSANLAGRPVGSLGEAERAALVGYLPQERRVAWNLPAWRVAALGAVNRPPVQAHAVALRSLGDLGMGELAERGVLEMSGGERGRVLVARLLATEAPLLVADEPAAGLDPDAQLLVLERLRARAEGGAAVVASLHDLTLAARMCDRLAVLHHGRLVALGPPAEALTPAVLAGAFSLDGEMIQTAAGPVVIARRLAS